MVSNRMSELGAVESLERGWCILPRSTMYPCDRDGQPSDELLAIQALTAALEAFTCEDPYCSTLPVELADALMGERN